MIQMDARGGGDNMSATSTGEGSSSRLSECTDVVRVVTRGRLLPDETRGLVVNKPLPFETVIS